MRIYLEQSARFVLLRLSGDIRLWNRPKFEEDGYNALRSVADDGEIRLLVLNLEEVERVDTRGIGLLARLVVGCAQRGIELRVVMPHGLAGEALRRVGIFTACRSFPSESQAIEGPPAASAIPSA